MNEVREQIADIIHKTLFFGREVSDEWIANQKSQGMPFTRERADQILSLEVEGKSLKEWIELLEQGKLVILDNDQSLPVIRYPDSDPIKKDREYTAIATMDVMLKAGFKKVKG